MKKLYTFFTAALLCSTSFAQLALWELSTITGTVPGPLNATQANVNLVTPVLSRGSGLVPGSLNTAYNSTQTNVAAPNNTKANAIASNEYYQFTVQANPAAFVSLSSFSARIRRNAAGANAYRWAYSTNGVTFTELGTADSSFTSTATNGIDIGPFDLSGIAALQNVPSATTITFRMYVWGATSASGGIAIGRFGTGNVGASLQINGSMSGVLPATLLQFGAAPIDNGFALRWTTATEVNTSHWNVLRSSDGSRFQQIARLEAAGNSSSTKTYLHNDVQVPAGKLYYQLVQVDKDGRETHSKIIAVSDKRSRTALTIQAQTNAQLWVEIASAESKKATLLLTNALGQPLQTIPITLINGVNNVQVPLMQLSKGLHMLTLYSSGAAQQSIRFVK